MSVPEYQVRWRQPAYIERARDTFLEIEVYDDGSISAPSSGTISVYNAAGTAVVDAQSVTIASSKANYTITAATVASESFGDDWRVEWTLVMGDTNTYLFRQDAALVRVRLAPVIADADLTARYPDLGSYLDSSLTSWEGFILEAWWDVVGRLESMGRRPYLIVSPEALRPVHLHTTLGLICRSLAGSGDPDNKWHFLADMHERKAEEAWATTTLKYDSDDDGDGEGERVGATVLTFLAGRA